MIEWIDSTFLITEKRFEAFGETIFESALLRIDGDGNLLNRDLITTDDASVAIYQMRNTNDGGFVMVGEINEIMVMNEQDLFVLKSGAMDDITNSYFNILLTDNHLASSVHDVEISFWPNPVIAGHKMCMIILDITRAIEIHSLTGARIIKVNAENDRLTNFTAPDKKGIDIIAVLLNSGEVVNKRLVEIKKSFVVLLFIHPGISK